MRTAPASRPLDASGAMPSDVPVFLLATERSGTNLLRRILGSHSRIAGPSPPHLIRWLLERQHYYGDLSSDVAFRRLAEHALFLVEHQLQPWSLALDADALTVRIPPGERTVLRLIGELYDAHAEQSGASRWFCKERLLAYYAFEIAHTFPTAQFIYLHRDPRDVFNSYLNVPGGPKHPYVFAEHWAEEQATAIRFWTTPATRSRILRISYESLLTDSTETIKRICRFLNEQFEDEMLVPPEDFEAVDTDNLYWGNLDREIMEDNLKKYCGSLSQRAIRIIEERAYRELTTLGYEPDEASRPVTLGDVRRGYYYVANRLLRYLHRFRFDPPKKEREMRDTRLSFRQCLEKQYRS